MVDVSSFTLTTIDGTVSSIHGAIQSDIPPDTHAKKFIYEATKKASRLISDIYSQLLRAMIYKFSHFIYIDAEGGQNSVKCIYGSPERPIAKMFQEDNLILPIISVVQPLTEEDHKRRKFFSTVVTEKEWDEKEQRAKRVISLVSKPINVEYTVTVWAKYKEDIDHVAEQIYLEFNPAAALRTEYSTVTQAFIVKESSLSTEAEDRQNRLLKKEFTIEVQSYVPSPKFLFTNTGKIEQFKVEGLLTEKPDSEDAPTEIDVTVAESVSLMLSATSPGFGPYWQQGVIGVLGEGFQNGAPGTNTVTFGGVSPLSIVTLSDDVIIANIPTFASGNAGSSLDVFVSNANGSATLTRGYTISNQPTITGVTIEASGTSSIVLIEGQYFDSGFAPHYTNNTTIRVGDISLDTSVLSDSQVSGLVGSGPNGSSVDLSVSSLNGSSLLTNGFIYRTTATEDTSIANLIVTWKQDPYAGFGGYADLSSAGGVSSNVEYPLTNAMEYAASKTTPNTEYIVQVTPGTYNSLYIGTKNNDSSKFQAFWKPNASHHQDSNFQTAPGSTIVVSGSTTASSVNSVIVSAGIGGTGGQGFDRCMVIRNASGLTFKRIKFNGNSLGQGKSNQSRIIYLQANPLKDASGNNLPNTLENNHRIHFIHCIIDGQFNPFTFTGQLTRWAFQMYGVSNFKWSGGKITNIFKEHGFYSHNHQGPIKIYDTSVINIGGNPLQAVAREFDGFDVPLPSGTGEIHCSGVITSANGYAGFGLDGNAGGQWTVGGRMLSTTKIHDCSAYSGFNDEIKAQVIASGNEYLNIPAGYLFGTRLIVISDSGQGDAGNIDIRRCRFEQDQNTGPVTPAGFESASGLTIFDNTFIAGGAVAGATSGQTVAVSINHPNEGGSQQFSIPTGSISSSGNTLTGDLTYDGNVEADPNDPTSW